jgi:hypothetical protein
MNQLSNHNAPERLSTEAEMEIVVSQAIRIANCQFIAIRETHGYLKRKVAELGIPLSEQELHAFSMSAWLELAKAKAWQRLPATRFAKKDDKPPRESKPAKTELFPRTEQTADPGENTRPFSTPGVSLALRKLRQMLRRDSIDEQELLSILRESTPQDAVAPETLDKAPARSLELLLSRWSVVRELVEAGRQDGGEAA